MYKSVKYRKFSSQRRFGIELEVGNSFSRAKLRILIRDVSDRPVYTSGWTQSNGNSYWHVKTDSTCGPKGPGKGHPKGCEVASFVAKGVRDLQHICKVADHLAASGVSVNNFCGLHIHADASDLTTEQVGTLVAYWLKIEHVLGMALPERRKGNPYCRSLSKERVIFAGAKYSAEDIWDIFQPSDIGFYDNQDRRVTLNLVNYARSIEYSSWSARRTIEFRWPEGTLAGATIKNWTRLFLNFIENCKDRPMPANLYPASLPEALAILGIGHDDTFYIFSEGLLDTKTWFLERIIEHLPQCSKTPSGTKAVFTKDAQNILNKMWTPLRKYA